ncbi:hypothetical protein ACRALDRAFT_213615 [Sodiomyces alcalophilus JCM 7366]|uniref:uncharacterized protein n=1 Tax=Sodiomyces alcalophilus JCM 7366 TaxID=591952 RepID=UPI0039B6225B
MYIAGCDSWAAGSDMCLHLPREPAVRVRRLIPSQRTQPHERPTYDRRKEKGCLFGSGSSCDRPVLRITLPSSIVSDHPLPTTRTKDYDIQARTCFSHQVETPLPIELQFLCAVNLGCAVIIMRKNSHISEERTGTVLRHISPTVGTDNYPKLALESNSYPKISADFDGHLNGREIPDGQIPELSKFSNTEGWNLTRVLTELPNRIPPCKLPESTASPDCLK